MSEQIPVTGAAQATTDATPTSTEATSTPAASPAQASTPATAQQPVEPVAAEVAAAESTETTIPAQPVKVVPEQYEAFKLPEGVQADPEVMTELQSVAKELGLSQDEAQRVNDVGVKAIQKIVTQQQEMRNTVIAGWDSASKTDKEFGGDALPASLSVAEKALNTFGTPELFKLLDDSGLRKHPEIIRAFFRAGKAISSDRLVPAGTRPNQNGVDAAKVLYPTN